MSEKDRRGVFGGAKPAYTVHRFKRTICLMLNEEMADELSRLLTANENDAKDAGQKVEPFLFQFNTQLQDAIDQPPPEKGEKPSVLAPGRPNPNVRAVS